MEDEDKSLGLEFKLRRERRVRTRGGRKNKEKRGRASYLFEVRSEYWRSR